MTIRFRRLFTMLAVTVLASSVFAQIEVVRYLNQETDPSIVTIQRNWVNNFVAQNPGIDVILEGAPAAVINQRITTYVQAGAPLDVIHADGGSAARLAAEGLLQPLDDVIEALGGRDAFLPGRLLIYDDKVYSINQAATSPVLHYRTDLFEAAGLQPPTTWDELLHAARTLNSADVAGIALPAGENRATTIYSGLFLWQNCGNYFDADLNVDLDNERTREAIEFYAELLKYAPQDASAWAFNEPVESFFAGRAAMVFYWNALDLTYRTNPGLLDVVSVVFPPAGHMKVTEQGGRYISLFHNSPNPEASKKWIQYIFTPENAQKLSEVQGQLYPPATYAAMDLLRTSEAPNLKIYGDLLFDVVFPASEFAYNQIFDGGGIDPESCTMVRTGNVNPLVSVVWNSNLYARAVQQVAYGGMSVDAAVTELQRNLSDQVEVARRELGGN